MIFRNFLDVTSEDTPAFVALACPAKNNDHLLGVAEREGKIRLLCCFSRFVGRSDARPVIPLPP